MAAKSEGVGRRSLTWAVLVAVVIAAGWAFPPFRVVRLAPATAGPAVTRGVEPAAAANTATAFDAKAVATKVWREQMPGAAAKAADADAVVALLQQSPDQAKARYGKTADLGSTYFFVRGRGRVVAHARNQLTIALDGLPGAVVALRIGPVFGNTVRDGCGLLGVNSFPGLAEFNALAAELNTLVEQAVLPGLRQQAPVGATVSFAGCAEAPEFAADPGEPVLTIVPVEAEVK